MRVSDMIVPATRRVVGDDLLPYYMHPFSGHIDHYREFEAENDEAAIAIAKGWREAGPMELWNLHRKLRHWDEVPFADG